jgi:hypothetical protein
MLLKLLNNERRKNCSVKLFDYMLFYKSEQQQCMVEHISTSVDKVEQTIKLHVYIE